MILLSFAICLLSCISLQAVPRLEWSADVDRVQPYRASLYRGETVTLACRLMQDRQPLDPSGMTAAFMWQTNGMGSAWWSAPAQITTNGVTVDYTPAMQPDADQVLFFIGLSDETATRRTYRATGILRILHAPGCPPNDLPLPPLRIDFARVSVTNAPWIITEADPIFSAYAQALNPWIESVTLQLSALADLPPSDALLSADNTTPNRLSADWCLLAGSSYYQPDFSLSASNLVYQTVGRWEHGTRLDRDGLYLRRDRQQVDITADGLYTLAPGDGATTYGPTGLLHQGPYPRLVETRISYPQTGRDDEVFALRSDVDRVADRAGYYWDDSAGVLWRLQVVNGYLQVVAITNSPSL